MCYNPITIRKQDGSYVQVKCNHCLECLQQKQRDWTARLDEQLKHYNGKAVFFTLTYNEDSVPKNYFYENTIFASPTDYAYSNAVPKRTKKGKISRTRDGEIIYRSIVSKERIKFAEVPYKELQDLGIDCSDIEDFNVTRTLSDEYVNNLQKMYYDYAIATSSYRDDDSSLCDSAHRHSEGTAQQMEDWEIDFSSELQMYRTDDVCDDFTRILNDSPIISDYCLPSAQDHAACGAQRANLVSARNEISNLSCPKPISFNSVRKDDVQNWLNRGRHRLRRNSDNKKDFTYFVASEYGPRTFRPHYHGILFGVTKEEVQFMFSDWNRHFGFSKMDNVQIGKGGIGYCCKYACKGMYEHPLCAKDFFYPHADGKFTEYHSRHYERCMDIFGVDLPMVEPSFILVSKGMGISYLDDNDFGVEALIDTNWKATEGQPTATIQVYRKTADNFVDMVYGICSQKDRIKAITQTSEKDYEEEIAKFIERFKYRRFNPVTQQVQTYNVPKYYREKVLSPGLRTAVANYLQQIAIEDYREQLRQLQAANPSREDAEIVSMLEKRSQDDYEVRKKRARKKVERQLNKSKI